MNSVKELNGSVTALREKAEWILPQMETVLAGLNEFNHNYNASAEGVKPLSSYLRTTFRLRGLRQQIEKFIEASSDFK